ncbi:hypothetical protein [Antrihabitans spumae]|jgi:hypothetical protein|uniref:Uncharacterized protein n=1 Tax=Antrihabitans spumae TaxID=3373370 RepID=A0ABW7KDC4_9NOCA
MNAEHQNIAQLISAMFSYEMRDGGVDYDTIVRIHNGDLSPWLTALDSSGLFDDTVLEEVRASWRRRPKALLEILLADSDEMTIRRSSVTWAVLDRQAPLAHIS